MSWPMMNQAELLLKKDWQVSKQAIIEGNKGSYKINRQKFLGRGGFGIVYVAIRCYQTEIGPDRPKTFSYEQVVLKEFKRSDRWNQELDKDKQILILQRFRKEWDNEYILPVIDIFQQKQTKLHFLVTAYAAGGSLFENLKKKFEQGQMLALVRRCAQILKYLHYDVLKNYRSLQKGKEQKQKLAIIHRDVKPANLVFKDNRLYLIDFGVAKIGYTSLQKSYSICGTNNYKAPQLSEQRIYNAKVDIYSFGCTLYEVFSGGDKLIGSAGLGLRGYEREMYVKNRLISLQTKLGRQQRYKYSYFWLQILNCCLAHNPKNRWSSEELNNFLTVTPMETYRAKELYFGKEEESQTRYRENKQIFEINFEVYRINLIQERVFAIFQHLYFEQPKISKFMLYGILKNVLAFLYDKFEKTKERCRTIKREDKVNLLKRLFDDRKLRDIREKAATKMRNELQREQENSRHNGNSSGSGNYEQSLVEQIADRLPEVLKETATDPRRTLYEFCFQMRSQLVEDSKFAQFVGLIVVMMEEPDFYQELKVESEEMESTDPELTSLKRLSRLKMMVEERIKKTGVRNLFEGLKIENTIRSGQNREESKTDIPIELVQQ